MGVIENQPEAREQSGVESKSSEMEEMECRFHRERKVLLVNRLGIITGMMEKRDRGFSTMSN